MKLVVLKDTFDKYLYQRSHVKVSVNIYFLKTFYKQYFHTHKHPDSLLKIISIHFPK